MKTPTDWSKKKLDAKWLIDSGLLFEINRNVLHIVGVALTFDQDGNVVLKDMREQPEKAVYDKATYELGKDKLDNFREFSSKQMDKRRNKLGWAYQAAV